MHSYSRISVRALLLFALLCLNVATAAAQDLKQTSGGDQFFPPSNIEDCGSNSLLLTWFGHGSGVSCMTGQDLLSRTLACSEGQAVVYEAGRYICKTPTAAPECAANEVLTHREGRYACVHTDVPTCGANQVLTFDGSGFVCVNRTDSIPTCGINQFLTYNGTSFQCANTPSITIPTCAAGQLLTASGGTLSCVALPDVDKNILYTQSFFYSYVSGDTPAKYNALMEEAINVWPPLIDNPEKAANVAGCTVDPSTGYWANASTPQWINNCGLMLCNHISGHFPSMSQLMGSCYVGAPNCGGAGLNGFAIAWSCLYNKH